MSWNCLPQPALLTRVRLRNSALGLLLLLSACGESTPQIEGELPQQIAWTAYNLGSTGYNQAVAIGAMLRNEYDVTLRVVPGQNDISRLLPLKTGRVEFSANGVANYFAQEGVFQFADPEWGPMPLRMLMSANGLFNQAVAVGADTGVATFADLRGKRVPFIRGAPALNVSMEAMLACGGLTWEDVIRVDFPGYDASWNGLINGDVDAAFGSTVSGPGRRLEASPRGIFWPPTPHDDEACWRGIHAIAPYFTRYFATRGPGISEENPHEGGTYPYPVLVAMDTQDEALVYWMTKSMHENYDSYKDSDPGAIGWALEYQLFDWVVPYHEGAVRYWREIGAWTDAFEVHNQELIRRQETLASAWQEVVAQGLTDANVFAETWMRVRAQQLQAAGFEPIWR